MMNTSDIFRSIINDLDIDDVPNQYICGAFLLDGSDMLIGAELEKLLNKQAPYNQTMSVTLVLDLKKISRDIHIEYDYIVERIISRFNAE